MTYFRCLAVIATLVLSAYGNGVFAAEVTPFTGPQVTGSGKGYDISIEGKRLGLADIQSLPTYQTTLKTAFGLEGTFVGVKLLDALQDGGIKDFKSIFVRAANDYKITVMSKDAGIDQALLAYSLNGKLLTLNDKGPYWLIWPQYAEALLAGEGSTVKWSWSVVDIRKIK